MWVTLGVGTMKGENLKQMDLASSDRNTGYTLFLFIMNNR